MEEIVDQVDRYSDPANWRTSKKGNPTIWIAGRKVTIWRSSTGRWSWAIDERGRDDRPLWAQAEFDSDSRSCSEAASRSPPAFVMIAEKAADLIRERELLPASNAPYYLAPDWETRQR